MHRQNRVNKEPKMWATYVIKNMSKVNTHPTGENSPNLVTLIITPGLVRGGYHAG
jgi:hypothetical protein